jgi:hypothetical protein
MACANVVGSANSTSTLILSLRPLTYLSSFSESLTSLISKHNWVKSKLYFATELVYFNTASLSLAIFLEFTGLNILISSF